MIKLELATYQAIQLDSLLQTLSVLASDTLPDSVKQGLMAGFESNSDLQSVAKKLRLELEHLTRIQEEKLGSNEGDEFLVNFME